MMNQFFRSNDVIITLQWPREAGAVYRVETIPEAPYTEFVANTTIAVINLTISYNIQYNVSIVSSLCGITTTKVLKYGRYEEIIVYLILSVTCVISKLPSIM